MRFKTLARIFLFCVFVLFYVYLSFLNPDEVKFYYGGGRQLELSVASFVVFSFLLGIIVSIIVSFFFDVKTGIGGWIAGKRKRKVEEFRESLEKARAYDLRGDREKAIESLQRIIRNAPQLEDTYICLAEIYTSMEEYNKATETLDFGEMNIGKKEGILLKKVRVNLTAKDYLKNESILKDILKINESSIDALRLLRDFYVGKKEWDNAYEIEKRVKKFIKTEEENRRFIGIRYERALTLFNDKFSQNTDKIIDTLKEIIGEDKRFIPAYILLAETYIKIGKLNEAGRVYGRGYTKTGHIEFLLKMEDLYINRGDPGAILKIYQRVLDLSPKDHLITFLYARLCLRLEMIDEALEMLDSLIEEGEEFRGLHRARAEAYIHREEMENAVAEFRKAFPMEEEVYIPFFCTKCQAVKHEWTDFCESCYSWNTINVKKEEFLRTDTTELRMIYDGEDWSRQND